MGAAAATALGLLMYKKHERNKTMQKLKPSRNFESNSLSPAGDVEMPCMFYFILSAIIDFKIVY